MNNKNKLEKILDTITILPSLTLNLNQLSELYYEAKKIFLLMRMKLAKPKG
ncbi:MAG: hypothetical protein GBAus27B_000316 [Mycoplasmataceae bacterium]|nr:MAG: hypothetical protein GBAus27B_000316 [Mycoplasmataceae bacterium]